MLFTWTNDIGEQLTISHSVAEDDQELVALSLKSGAIVSVCTANGYFQFTFSNMRRALRASQKGDTLIFPCGKVLQVTD